VQDGIVDPQVRLFLSVVQPYGLARGVRLELRGTSFDSLGSYGNVDRSMTVKVAWTAHPAARSQL